MVIDSFKTINIVVSRLLESRQYNISLRQESLLVDVGEGQYKLVRRTIV